MEETSRLERIAQLEKELARLKRMANVADRAEQDMMEAMIGGAVAEAKANTKTWSEWQQIRKTDPQAYQRASATGRIAADLASLGRAKFYEGEE